MKLEGENFRLRDIFKQSRSKFSYPFSTKFRVNFDQNLNFDYTIAALAESVTKKLFLEVDVGSFVRESTSIRHKSNFAQFVSRDHRAVPFACSQAPFPP